MFRKFIKNIFNKSVDFHKIQRKLLHSTTNNVKNLFTQSEINSQSQTGLNIIQYAITAHSNLSVPFKELVDEYLRLGGNLEHKNNDGLTALHFAVAHKKPDILKYLIEKGADIDASDNNGMTPLYLAVSTYTGEPELLEIIKILLKYGANPDKKNKAGVSPSDFASIAGEGIDEGYNPKEWDLRTVLASAKS